MKPNMLNKTQAKKIVQLQKEREHLELMVLSLAAQFYDSLYPTALKKIISLQKRIAARNRRNSKS